MAIYLIRHAHAGSRSRWRGPDHERPLSAKGQLQAKVIGERLAGVGIGRVLSSPYLRCLQSVEPLAGHLGLTVEVSDELAEATPLKGILDLIDQAGDQPIALCSHGDLIPATIDWLARHGADADPSIGTQKGSVWELQTVAGGVISASYTPPPDVPAS